jgi:phosphatidylserine synthase
VNSGAIRHLLGSVGVLSALFAVLAVFDQSWETVYAWLGLGILVQIWDCFEAKPRRLPEPTAGAVQSLSIIAFLNSVFVPVVAMLHAGFLDGIAGVVVGGLILLSAQYRLCFLRSSERAPFTGFPAVWSIVGFHLHAFDATPAAAILAIGLGIVFGLLPLNWPHPLWSRRWPLLTRAVAVVWLVTAAAALWHGFPATTAAKAVFVAAGIYGALLTVLLAREKPATAGRDA